MFFLVTTQTKPLGKIYIQSTPKPLNDIILLLTKHKQTKLLQDLLDKIQKNKQDYSFFLLKLKYIYLRLQKKLNKRIPLPEDLLDLIDDYLRYEELEPESFYV